LNLTNGCLGILGQNQQDIIRTKHIHCLLHGRSFIRSLQENRRNRVSSDALAQML
jgi:hypothetical protein